MAQSKISGRLQSKSFFSTGTSHPLSWKSLGRLRSESSHRRARGNLRGNDLIGSELPRQPPAAIYRTKEKLPQVPVFFIDEAAGLLYGVITD